MALSTDDWVWYWKHLSRSNKEWWRKQSWRAVCVQRVFDHHVDAPSSCWVNKVQGVHRILNHCVHSLFIWNHCLLVLSIWKCVLKMNHRELRPRLFVGRAAGWFAIVYFLWGDDARPASGWCGICIQQKKPEKVSSRESLLSIIIFNQIWFYVDGVARTEVSGVDYKLNWQGTKHVTSWHHFIISNTGNLLWTKYKVTPLFIMPSNLVFKEHKEGEAFHFVQTLWLSFSKCIVFRAHCFPSSKQCQALQISKSNVRTFVGFFYLLILCFFPF